MRVHLIIFGFLFLFSCGSIEEEKLILGNWKVDFEKSWNRKIKSLDKTDKQTYDKLVLSSKKRRLNNYQKSIEKIEFVFKDDNTFDFLAENSVVKSGNWEVFMKDEVLFLALENTHKQIEVFELSAVNKSELILKVDKLDDKLVLSKK